MTPERVLALLDRVSDAVGRALAQVVDWDRPGGRESQYGVDLVADAAALDVLSALDVNVLSEESGLSDRGHRLTVIVDPLDGSTNASRRVPHYATSLCVVDEDGPLAALVVHRVSGRRWWAVRGGGAFCDGVRLPTPSVREWSECVVAVSGRPPDGAGWAQFRAFGASAIDMCMVADGSVDAFIDMSPSAHGVWDYAAALLVCREVGLRVEDAQGRDRVVLDPLARRTPMVADGSHWEQALAVRRRLPL